MNITRIVVVVAMAVVMSGCSLSPTKQSNTQQGSSSQSPLPQEITKQEESKMKLSDTGKMMPSFGYQEYSDGVLESSRNKKRVLFFYASWCPTCRSADVSFREKSAQIPEDVAIIRVNYNDPDTDAQEKSLASKYGVTYQHTFIQIDSEGEAVHRWNGGQFEELLDQIK